MRSRSSHCDCGIIRSRPHPYVTTLRIDVINPGDGLLALNAIREIQKFEEFKALNYDVALYADQGYEIMGSAFDEMTEGATLAEGSQPDVDEELLRPNQNPLFPKLTFSKQKVTETEWRNIELREAHITILIDRFSTKVLTRQTQPPPASFCIHNLLAEYRADFDVKDDSATWSRKVVPNQKPSCSPAPLARRRFLKPSTVWHAFPLVTTTGATRSSVCQPSSWSSPTRTNTS